MADDKVGYGKPPEETRFKKGTSGNPKGRRKGSRSLKNLIKEALEEQVTVTINGRPKTTTRAELIAKQVTHKAMSGEMRAIEFVDRCCHEPKRTAEEMKDVDMQKLTDEELERIIKGGALYQALYQEQIKDGGDSAVGE